MTLGIINFLSFDPPVLKCSNGENKARDYSLDRQKNGLFVFQAIEKISKKRVLDTWVKRKFNFPFDVMHRAILRYISCRNSSELHLPFVLLFFLPFIHVLCVRNWKYVPLCHEWIKQNPLQKDQSRDNPFEKILFYNSHWCKSEPVSLAFIWYGPLHESFIVCYSIYLCGVAFLSLCPSKIGFSK